MDYACYVSKTSSCINIGESGLNFKFSKINQFMEDRVACPTWKTTVAQRFREQRIGYDLCRFYMRAAAA